MKAIIKSAIASALRASALQYWPVTVRAGLAKGARWTAFPFSSNWRAGGETDLAKSIEWIGGLKGACCWDLGAHFGIHTVGLARCVGATGEIVGLEPDPVAFRRLAYHVNLNELTQVKLYEAAASDADGTLELIIAGELGSTVTHAKYEGETITAEGRSFFSRSIRLDSLVESGEIRPPNLIKIDVEGHGAKAIAGALSAIAKMAPAIVLSLHSPNEWFDTAELLQAMDYRPRAINSGKQMSWKDYPGSSTVALLAGP